MTNVGAGRKRAEKRETKRGDFADDGIKGS